MTQDKWDCPDCEVSNLTCADAEILSASGQEILKCSSCGSTWVEAVEHFFFTKILRRVKFCTAGYWKTQ